MKDSKDYATYFVTNYYQIIDLEKWVEHVLHLHKHGILTESYVELLKVEHNL